MESSATTDATLGLYRELRAAGHENVGVVLQSRLRRTVADVPGLANVRLCKGIYVEPEAVAFQDDDEVRASFVRSLEALLAEGAYVGVATHDERLLGEALRLVRERGLGRDEYELQMLLGVRPERARRARPRRAPAARLRPVRDALVRVLAPAPAGEPGDRAVRRRRPLPRARSVGQSRLIRKRAITIRTTTAIPAKIAIRWKSMYGYASSTFAC